MKNTGELLSILVNINKKSDLQQFSNKYLEKSNTITLSQYLENMIQKYNKTKSQVIKESCIPRTYAYQIFMGIRKPGRDKLLALCLAIGMDLEDTQRALTLGSLGILYSKKKRDATIIFSINKKLSVLNTNELLYDLGESILE